MYFETNLENHVRQKSQNISKMKTPFIFPGRRLGRDHQRRREIPLAKPQDRSTRQEESGRQIGTHVARGHRRELQLRGHFRVGGFHLHLLWKLGHCGLEVWKCIDQ